MVFVLSKLAASKRKKHGTDMPGISGLSLYVPSSRVPLTAWCDWTGAVTDKVKAVVGDAFRVASGNEDIYTLAAGAVLRLLDAYGVDPSRVGYLVLATESSTDNAVGGPTVHGLVNKALAARQQTLLPRHVETFEMKQACLSGINGVLAATRFVTLEPNHVAIVVASDIAEYARGSSGEQTQGAGAVAMLVEADARLLHLDVTSVGRSAADRVCDFRKPTRSRSETAATEARPKDFPVFAGQYSTQCYLDAVDRAFVHLLERTGAHARTTLDQVAMILHHRPYEKMPVTSLARMYLRKWLEEDEASVSALAEAAETTIEHIKAGLDVNALPLPSESTDTDQAIGGLARLVRLVTKTKEFKAFATTKSRLGRKLTRELGNLYSASLPAWMGSAFEEAAGEEPDLKGQRILLFGYGSGDAALAVSASFAEGWREASRKIAFTQALEGAVDIDRLTYEQNHDRTEPIHARDEGRLVIERVGAGPDDPGVPYYAYASPAA